MILNRETFGCVLAHTPLISIDLLVENKMGQVLLGKRVNEPAKDFWFVPGGRVFKDESLDTAFCRITKEELGFEIKRADALFDKTYEHFYENNVFNNDFSTHYIVLAHKIYIDKDPLLNTQHSEYRWFEKQELLQDKNTHRYTKDYFR